MAESREPDGHALDQPAQTWEGYASRVDDGVSDSDVPPGEPKPNWPVEIALYALEFVLFVSAVFVMVFVNSSLSELRTLYLIGVITVVGTVDLVRTPARIWKVGTMARRLLLGCYFTVPLLIGSLIAPVRGHSVPQMLAMSVLLGVLIFLLTLVAPFFVAAPTVGVVYFGIRSILHRGPPPSEDEVNAGDARAAASPFSGTFKWAMDHPLSGFGMCVMFLGIMVTACVSAAQWDAWLVAVGIALILGGVGIFLYSIRKWRPITKAKAMLRNG